MEIIVPLYGRYAAEDICRIVHSLQVTHGSDSAGLSGLETHLLGELDAWVNKAYCQEQADKSSGKLRSVGAGRDDYYHAGRLELLDELRKFVKQWRAKEARRGTRRICSGEDAPASPGQRSREFRDEIAAAIKDLFPGEDIGCNALTMMSALQRAGHKRLADVPREVFADAVLNHAKDLNFGQRFDLLTIARSPRK